MSQFIDLQLFSSERKEPATPRRRQMAREKGQIALSQDLTSAAGFFAAVLALRYTFTFTSKFIVARSQAVWSASLPSEATLGWGMAVLRSVFAWATLAAAPVAAAALVFGAGASIIQGGLQFHPHLIAPDFSRLNPLRGLTRLFSRRALADGLRSLLKVALVGILTWNALRTVLPQVSTLLVRGLSNSVEITVTTIEKLLMNCGVFLVGAGVLDYIYQWWEHEKSLRMTQREVRDELRDAEVKPEVRSAIRARQRQMARMRMMQEVPKADVVIVNPTHYAVALKYDISEKPAPVVVAKGVDDVALRIKKIALEAKVQVVENPPLARGLYKAAEVGEMIPPDMYKAVAEVLAYVYRVAGKGPKEARVV
ncbi:MAG: flagellar biosynthesis protein FlhB [Bacillota bacterium]